MNKKKYKFTWQTFCLICNENKSDIKIEFKLRLCVTKKLKRLSDGSGYCIKNVIMKKCEFVYIYYVNLCFRKLKLK